MRAPCVIFCGQTLTTGVAGASLPVELVTPLDRYPPAFPCVHLTSLCVYHWINVWIFSGYIGAV
jgi:hypothetical protein